MTGPPPYGPPGERDQCTSPPVPPGVAPDITYTGPLPQPPATPVTPRRSHRPPQDRRVWPPPDREDEDRATQPFPALRGLPISAAPSPRLGPPPGAAGPALPRSPAPIGPGPTVVPVAAPAPDEVTVEAAVDEAGSSARHPVTTGDSPARHPVSPARHPVSPGRRRGRRRRTLIGMAAAMLAVLAIGVPGWFGYRALVQGSATAQVRLVPPGKAGVAQHVAWQASLQEISDPSGQPDTADRQWMKIVLTRTALDDEGTIRHSAPEVTLTDRSGGQWRTDKVSDETPPVARDNTVGVPYRIELVAVVPPSIVDEVEILLRPSTHRDAPDWSVGEVVQALVASMERQDEVLRFLR